MNTILSSKLTGTLCPPVFSFSAAICLVVFAVATPLDVGLSRENPTILAQSQAGFYAGWPSIYPWGYGTGVDYPLYSTEPPKPPAAPSGLDLTTQRAIPHAKFVEWATPTSERGYARVIPREEPRVKYW